MFRLLVALAVCSMTSGGNAQDWIAKGTRAYAAVKLDESAANFKKAVELDPHSGQAWLCYGVISSFLYLNALNEASAPSNHDVQHVPSQAEFDADVRRTQTMVPEVNRTLGKQAEDRLRQALEIDPHNLAAKEHLAGLYFWWRDLDEGESANTYPSRLDEAHRVYQEIVAGYPRNRSANYMLGVIDWNKASRLVRRSGRYPRPLEDAQARATLNVKFSPLMEEAVRVLSVAIEIEPNNWFPMSYLLHMKLLQAYVAPTEEEAKRAKSEADAWQRKIQSFPGMEPKAWGQNSSADNGGLVFERRPGPMPIPSFPPEPMLPPGIPPPPPWPPPGRIPQQ